MGQAPSLSQTGATAQTSGFVQADPPDHPSSSSAEETAFAGAGGGLGSSPNVPKPGTSIDPNTGKPYTAGLTRIELAQIRAAKAVAAAQAEVEAQVGGLNVGQEGGVRENVGGAKLEDLSGREQAARQLTGGLEVEKEEKELPGGYGRVTPLPVPGTAEHAPTSIYKDVGDTLHTLGTAAFSALPSSIVGALSNHPHPEGQVSPKRDTAALLDQAKIQADKVVHDVQSTIASHHPSHTSHTSDSYAALATDKANSLAASTSDRANSLAAYATEQAKYLAAVASEKATTLAQHTSDHANALATSTAQTADSLAAVTAAKATELASLTSAKTQTAANGTADKPAIVDGATSGTTHGAATVNAEIGDTLLQQAKGLVHGALAYTGVVAANSPARAAGELTAVVPKVSLPSNEPAGALPGERSSGVGALPGKNTEAGVAVLPDEKAPKLSLPSQEVQGAVPSETSGGVGALPGVSSEKGVALLPHERGISHSGAPLPATFLGTSPAKVPLSTGEPTSASAVESHDGAGGKEHSGLLSPRFANDRTTSMASVTAIRGGHEGDRHNSLDSAVPTPEGQKHSIIPFSLTPGNESEGVGHPSTRGNESTSRSPGKYPKVDHNTIAGEGAKTQRNPSFPSQMANLNLNPTSSSTPAVSSGPYTLGAPVSGLDPSTNARLSSALDPEWDIKPLPTLAELGYKNTQSSSTTEPITTNISTPVKSEEEKIGSPKRSKSPRLPARPSSPLKSPPILPSSSDIVPNKDIPQAVQPVPVSQGLQTGQGSVDPTRPSDEIKSGRKSPNKLQNFPEGPRRSVSPIRPLGEHERTTSNASESKKKVGFMNKLKGEIKVFSGKIKNDQERVQLGERMKNGDE
ncbi:hypothetical protein TREMEDRAFT_73420 [Tremella mesenterica DSM 1558]|uniref:uncharacterized protein n=1 Tax=Tremella mesenterica (strain ATCC 24925 / CBS 8224 / DSM 1558 / NBRC 9311 / NRRL Y-6157 / RJB 2259-6 / UBC 559-6) TaxID=578456 RepID=UPI0003F48D66|nr:uncharacterized protein TREMEDRAFT_73420 [Tremella mesenterica DSM 1558]EIW71843.1 hypothetical protein TREMEDRAFT_73420 [Tremella mesenterica DSM 1558]